MTLPLPHLLGAFVIPQAETGDADAVRFGLALARESFERGDVREALRCLRRAAEDADTAGDELRAVALARAAADLATEVGTLAPPALSSAASASSVNEDSVVRRSSDAALDQLLQSGRAVKVMVKRSTRDEGLYVVRLADASGSALGAREAVLVLLEPDAAFFSTQEE